MTKKLLKELEGNKTFKSLQAKIDALEKQIGTGDSIADNTDICDVEPLRVRLTDCLTPAVDMFQRIQANGATHEWNVITATGASTACGYSAMETCGTPNCTKPEMTRYSVPIKMFGDCADVCEFNQEASANYLDLQAETRANSIKIITQDVECETWYGDTTANPLSFDGLERLTLLNAPGNYTNAAGAAFNLNTLNTAIRTVAENCGSMPTHLFMGAKDIQGFNQALNNQVQYNDPKGNLEAGYNTPVYWSPWGKLKVVYDPFITAQADGFTDIFIVDINHIGYAQLGPGIQSMPLARTALSKAEAIFWKVALEVRSFAYQGVYANIL